MQFSTVFVALFASIAMAGPVQQTATAEVYNTDGSYAACSGLYSTLQCCATDVLGVADLDCATPGGVPSSPKDFQGICAKGGQRARCCVLPILGQDVLCQTPLGL
ncbi:fungal hydrophobin [Astrocystis sublimbata]|nr:fungal hydrophobin [Astrocystis sublimbata]